MSTKIGKKAGRLAKRASAAAKNPKKAIQDAKFESMKKRTAAARKPGGKEPGMAQKRKIYDARRSSGLQVTRENLVDMKSRGKIKDPRNAAEEINLMKTATGTANYNRAKSINEEYNKYYSDAEKQMAKKKEREAFAARARSQKVGRRKPNGR